MPFSGANWVSVPFVTALALRRQVRSRRRVILRVARLGGEALAARAVGRIAGPAAGEILPHAAIRLGLRVLHQDLGAIRELRDAAHRRDEGERHLRARGVGAELRVNAARVVVVAEDDEPVRVRVEEIVRERLVNVDEPRLAALGLRQALDQRMLQREIHE